MASGLEKEIRLEDEEVGVYRRRKRMKAVKKRRICDSSDEADSIKEKGKERAEEKDCGRRQGWHVEEGIIVIHSSEDVGQKRRSVGKKHRKRRRSAGEKSDKKEVERDKRRKREDIFQKEESGEDSGRKDRERRGPGVIEKRHYKKDEEEEDEEMVHCRRKKKAVVERWRIIDSSEHVIEKMESIKAGARKRKKTTAGEDVGVERKYHRKRDKAREDEERPGGSGVQKAGPGETASIYIQRLSFHHQLGKGSFGKVLLAEDCLTGLQLAVKIMRKRDLLQEERELVLVERRVLQIASGSAFLTHGYLAFQTKNHLVLGLEYASGGDFHQFLRRKGCLNITSATFYAAEITCGVEYLHSKGIIHRDLKPENILVAGSGHLKIADYGLAIDNIFGDQTATEYAGTPGYIAPEMLAGEEYNAGVDWFSFGVILNRMITGTIHYNHSLFHKSGAVAKNIIKKLLCEDPPRRLGVNGNIRQHRFFQHIDWVSLEALRVTPPCVPVPPTITPPSRRFDFEKMEAAEDQIRPIRAEEQDVFRGFSFISAKCRAFPRTPLI